MKQIVGRIIYHLIFPVRMIVVPRTVRPRVVLTHKQDILLVKDTIGSGKWCLPGGGKHKYETSVEAAVRELSEETGIKLNPADLSEIGVADMSDRRIKYHAPLFHYAIKNKPNLQLSSELLDARWFTMQNLPSDTKQEVLSVASTLLK